MGVLNIDITARSVGLIDYRSPINTNTPEMYKGDRGCVSVLSHLFVTYIYLTYTGIETLDRDIKYT